MADECSKYQASQAICSSQVTTGLKMLCFTEAPTLQPIVLKPSPSPSQSRLLACLLTTMLSGLKTFIDICKSRCVKHTYCAVSRLPDHPVFPNPQLSPPCSHCPSPALPVQRPAGAAGASLGTRQRVASAATQRRRTCVQRDNHRSIVSFHQSKQILCAATQHPDFVDHIWSSFRSEM